MSKWHVEQARETLIRRVKRFLGARISKAASIKLCLRIKLQI